MSLKTAPYLADLATVSRDPEGVSEGCADPYLPTIIPSKRWDYSVNWDMKIVGPMKEFDLGKQPFLSGLINKLTSKVTLIHPEIHVVWRGLVPPSICKDDVVITCRFTPDLSEKLGLLAQHNHGMHLYMHHVFYPGHSIKLGPGESIPWAIGFSIPDFSLKTSYIVAEVHVRLTGYFSVLPEYAPHKDSELISIVPIDEHVTGFATSAPRAPNKSWAIRGYKIGVDGKTQAKKIKFLQDIGVDIEAIRMIGKLSSIMKLVTTDAVKPDAPSSVKSLVAKNVQKALISYQN